MKHSAHAFSLVELSIVLVILGLLTGGILSGQSLIRASELRAAISEYQRYSTAAQSFRDKYFAVPGDMNNADQFWGYEGGAASNCSTAYAGTIARTGTCDGDGNGILTGGSAPSMTGEMFQFWKQLALAGMIEGSYTGFSGPTVNTPTGVDSTIGVNVPKSKMSNAGWTVQGVGNFPGDANAYAGNYGNAFVLGGPNPGGQTVGQIMKAEEAWNIDTKLDDGKPGTGKVLAYWWQYCTNSANKTDYTGVYNLSSPSNSCALYFTNQF